MDKKLGFKDFLSVDYAPGEPDQVKYNAKKRKVEAKAGYCSDKCCGSDVKREDCTCPPTCKHCNCNDPKVDEGKYKNDAQRKAVHASKNEKKKNETYKESLASRLNEKVSSCCSDCGKDSYTTLNLSDKELEEVAGPDKCWKGYKKAGTQKGTGKNAGKRVNKCVKA